MNIVETAHLTKIYGKKHNQILAVDDVSLNIKKGEILGLVGESGCGKSTFGKMILNLEKSTKGKIYFNGRDITNLSFDEMRPVRKNMQMIFQNSLTVFNPYCTVYQIIKEPLDNYLKGQEKEQQIIEMLEKVGLDESYLSRYPNELSGGQRQRIGIARALIISPEFVVCDEPTSSVDYAVRNRILDLLADLKVQLGMTYLLISHDLSAVKKICDRIVVMYMGNIMEILPESQKMMEHPYSKALIAATLGTNPKERGDKKVLFKKEDEGIAPVIGCVFQNRCLYVQKICKIEKPMLRELRDMDGHMAACHLCK